MAKRRRLRRRRSEGFLTGQLLVRGQSLLNFQQGYGVVLSIGQLLVSLDAFPHGALGVVLGAHSGAQFLASLFALGQPIQLILDCGEARFLPTRNGVQDGNRAEIAPTDNDLDFDRGLRASKLEKLGGDIFNLDTPKSEVDLTAAPHSDHAVFGALGLKLFQGDQTEPFRPSLSVVSLIGSHPAQVFALAAVLGVPLLFAPIDKRRDVLLDSGNSGVFPFAVEPKSPVLGNDGAKQFGALVGVTTAPSEEALIEFVYFGVPALDSLALRVAADGSHGHHFHPLPKPGGLTIERFPGDSAKASIECRTSKFLSL